MFPTMFFRFPSSGVAVTIGVPLGYHWGTAGCVTTGLPLGYHWGTIGLPLGYYWVNVGMPLGYHWVTIGVPLGYHWITAGLPSGYRRITVGLPLGHRYTGLYGEQQHSAVEASPGFPSLSQGETQVLDRGCMSKTSAFTVASCSSAASVLLLPFVGLRVLI